MSNNTDAEQNRPADQTAAIDLQLSASATPQSSGPGNSASQERPTSDMGAASLPAHSIPVETNAQSVDRVVPGNVQRPTSVRDILSDFVTAHMSPFVPLLREGHTVSESLDAIRHLQHTGRAIYFYVVDEQDRLRGVVSTRRLLFTSPGIRIADVMSSTVVSIPSTATVLEACEFFTLHKLLAFPVVDAEQKIVGVIDIDLYTDEIRELDRRQDSDDLFQLIGVHLSDAVEGNARGAFVGRFPWLLCNVAGGMLSAFIADAYQDISTLAVVAPFISLVTALAESVSIQSVSLAIQALHTRPSGWSAFGSKLGLEVVVGLLLGCASGLTVAIVAWIWKRSILVALSLFLGIAGGVAASAVIGLSMPFLLKMLRRDPQLASGPIALTLSDIVTLFCYFNLGKILLSGF